MKAIRVHEFGGPEVLRIEDVPDPEPGPGQVVVVVHAAGVNPVDTYVRSGKYAHRPALPYTPGSDSGGIIAAVGDGVFNLSVGDWVYTFGSVSGTYAERAVCVADAVRRLPELVSFAQGAGVGVPCGAAWRALFDRGHAEPGDYVLVHGATGGVGTAAVQMARAAGAIVIGSAGSEAGKHLALSEGAHYALGHEEATDPDRIKALTNGHGLDVILEMLANVNLARDLGVVAKHGRIVVIGSRGTIEIDPRMTMATECSIMGMMLGAATAEETDRMHASLGAMLVNGTLRPLVDEEFPLSQAAEAHKAVMEGESKGKIILVPEKQ